MLFGKVNPGGKLPVSFPRSVGQVPIYGCPSRRARSRSFTLDKSDFGFYDNRGRFVVEPGAIDVHAGDSSAADEQQSFTVTR